MFLFDSFSLWAGKLKKHDRKYLDLFSGGSRIRRRVISRGVPEFPQVMKKELCITLPYGAVGMHHIAEMLSG